MSVFDKNIVFLYGDGSPIYEDELIIIAKVLHEFGLPLGDTMLDRVNDCNTNIRDIGWRCVRFSDGEYCAAAKPPPTSVVIDLGLL